MDIWRWVYARQEQLMDIGHDRLAELMGAIPHAVVDDEPQLVESLVQEALALARSLDDRWVEIYLRHWYRQMRGGGLGEVHDAVDLFELAHREQNTDCPQSVCAVQDLAIAYSGADALGYAVDRHDISAETLERIDPTWGCFTCISVEHSSALRDLGRPDEALSFCERQRKAIVDARTAVTADLVNEIGRNHLAAGRPGKALSSIDAAVETTFGERGRRTRAMLRAHAHAVAGELDVASSVVLPFDEIVGLNDYEVEWALVAEALVAGPWTNDWELGVQLERLLGQLVVAGRPRKAIAVAAVHARLASARGAARTAASAADVARAQLPRLAADCGAADVVTALDAAVEAMPTAAVELPDSPEQLRDRVQGPGPGDLEEFLDQVVAGTERWPDDAALVQLRSGVERALGRVVSSVQVLQEWYDRVGPGHEEAGLALGFTLLDAQHHAELERHIEALEAGGAARDADWLRANRALRAGDHDGAVDAALRVARAVPDARNTRRLIAEAGLEAGRWRDVLDATDELLLLEPDDETAPWLSLAAATATGDWTVVRARARALGMPVDGDDATQQDAPIDEEWGLVDVVVEGRDPVVAMRTGPATARVLEVTRPGEPQLVTARVLLAPFPVSVPDEGDDARVVLRALTVLEPALRWTVELEGLDPGAVCWAELERGCAALGWELVRRSDDRYRVGSRRRRKGVYAWLAVPTSVDAASTHAALTGLTAGWRKLQVIWPSLAREAGDHAAEAAHRELADTHGISLG